MTLASSPARYAIVRSLATGASCEVVLLADAVSGHRIVHKTLKPEIVVDSPSGRSLRDEARILAEISHPNLVTYMGFEEALAGEAAPGRVGAAAARTTSATKATLVLEYVEGADLKEVLARKGTLTPAAATHIALELARALTYLHAQGLVHGNLEPSNVLCHTAGAVKLADFGATTRGSRGTNLGEKNHDARQNNPRGRAPLRVAAGPSSHYAAPEQLLAGDVDERTDLYALGVILHEMLTGRTPFAGAPLGTLVTRVRNEDVPRLRARYTHVPPDLDVIVGRLLKRQAGERYTTASAVVADLARAVQHGAYADKSTVLAALFVTAKATSLNGVASAERAWIPFALVGIGFVVLAACVQLGFGASRAHLALGQDPLPLVPETQGSLRVLATPWAEVWVDGQKVETTPFAKPIPLASGPHVVVLKHPFASEDSREILVKTNETVQIEAVMNLQLYGYAGAIAIDRDAGSSTSLTREQGTPRGKLKR